jgi:hypothetical protein
MDSKLEIISFANNLSLSSELITVTDASQLLEGGKYFDIAIFDESSHLDFEDYREVCENSDIFTIAIINSTDSIEKYKDSSKAWILKDNLTILDKLLFKIKDDLILRKELYYAKEGLAKLVVSNSAHIANIDMVKDLINESTTAIAKNFECRVSEIRELDSSIGAIMSKLDSSMQKLDGDKEELQESLKTTQELHNSMKQIIKSLFSYVSILQCEDRLFQMLDGVSSIMKDTQYLNEESFLNIDREKKEDLLRELVQYYTIQEQRDFVLGIKEDKEDIESQSSELILF